MDEFDVFATEAEQVQEPVQESKTVSPKSRLTTVLLTFLTGFVGVDFFYKGKKGLGIFNVILWAVLFIPSSVFLFAGIVMMLVPVAGWIADVILFLIVMIIMSPVNIWVWVRGIMALCGASTDKQGRKIKNWKNK